MNDRQFRPDGFVPAVGVWRGKWCESLHWAAAVVVDGAGAAIFSLGDVQRPLPWRSTAKPFQAWTLVESGASARFDTGMAGVAIACASHGGESFHLEAVRALLASGGLSEADLLCGAHPPMHAAAARRLVREASEPTSLHNNCSGKHAAMLLTTTHLGGDPRLYLEPDSPVQQAIARSVALHAGVDKSLLGAAVDGCSAPTFVLSLQALAVAYARLAATLEGSGDESALTTIARAMVTHPELVAGTDRLDTLLMRACPGRLIAKVGAEGVYAVGAMGPRGPIGMALKIADGGSDRARHALVLGLVARLGLTDAAANETLAEAFPLAVKNHRGWVVGEVRVRTEVFAASPGLK